MSNEKTALMYTTCPNNNCQGKGIWDNFPYDNESLKKLVDDFNFCPYCREELSWKCSKCNHLVYDPNPYYCSECGCKFEKAQS